MGVNWGDGESSSQTLSEEDEGVWRKSHKYKVDGSIEIVVGLMIEKEGKLILLTKSSHTLIIS